MNYRRTTTLSPTERDVLAYLGDGKTTAAIAKLTRRSIKTIYTHCDRIKRKLGARNFNELIRTAVLSRDCVVPEGLEILLDRTETIEIRFIDERRKVIQTRKYRAD